MAIKLDVIIVGAGIAGLTCAIALARYPGVNVLVLERTSAILPVGNGLQVPGNACHVLRSLGLLDKLIAKSGGTAPGCLSMDYRDGRVLLDRDFGCHEEIYGAPWLLVHRADYIDILLEEARRCNVKIKLDCQVCEVDCDTPRVALTNGDVYTADVIVGCDGINSRIRKVLHPTVEPRLTNAFAYRALFTPEQLSLSLFAELRKSRYCRFWLGPRTHVVFYPLRGGSVYNMVLIVADKAFHVTRSDGDITILRKLRAYMAGWDPVVRGLLDVADGIVSFPLKEVGELPSWSRGCVTLMGDAAHPTLPYLGQGAAMAVEDAMVLATMLGTATRRQPAANTDAKLRRKHIQVVLSAYESLQRPRTATIVRRSRENGAFNHLGRGPAQRARDEDFANFRVESTVSACPWIDASFSRELLGRNSELTAIAEFGRLVNSSLGTQNDWIPRSITEQDTTQEGHSTILQARL